MRDIKIIFFNQKPIFDKIKKGSVSLLDGIQLEKRVWAW